MASGTEGDTKMSFTELAILGILLVLVLMFLKMPVGLAMALGGFIVWPVARHPGDPTAACPPG